MEIIDVVDSAVKIGLGALISGVVTYLAAKHSHERELQKISFVRRLDSLEQVSEKAEAHFVSWRRFASRIGGIYSGRNAPSPDFSEKQWNLILTRDKDLLETREALGYAVARLRLLSATEAASCLSNFSKIVGEFRDDLILKRETPKPENFRNVRKEVNECIKRFHEEMSLTYLAAGQNKMDELSKSFKNKLFDGPAHGADEFR